MDIFKQKRYLILATSVLVVLNISTLVMLWIDRSAHQQSLPPQLSSAQQEERIRMLLHQELGFTEPQASAYMNLRGEHTHRIHKLKREVDEIKRQMFDAVLQTGVQPTLSDSLLNLAQKKQAQIERLTFQHFLDLKALCTPEQEQHLQHLLHQLFQRHQGNGAPPHRGEQPQQRPPGFH